MLSATNFLDALKIQDHHTMLRQLHVLLGSLKFKLKVKLITKTRLFKYIENLTTKNWKFSDKYSDIFHIFAQNTDNGYSLEWLCWGGFNE